MAETKKSSETGPFTQDEILAAIDAALKRLMDGDEASLKDAESFGLKIELRDNWLRIRVPNIRALLENRLQGA